MIIKFDEKENPIKIVSLLHGLGIEDRPAPVISVVGAGGKTTIIERIASESAEEGKGVLITTTTHIHYPQKGCILREESGSEHLQYLLEKEKIIYAVKKDDNRPGKAAGMGERAWELLLQAGCPILIEADGAKGLPCKIPAAHEPVIRKETTMLIGVLGLDCIGKAIRDCCHRPEQVAGYLGKTMGHRMEPMDLVTLAASDTGLRKGLTASMTFTVIWNKWDEDAQGELPHIINTACHRRGMENILWITKSKKR